MDIETYSSLALRTASSADDTLVHAALGIAGEAGEIADYIKKVIFNGKQLDSDHLVEEIGDQMWYLNLLVTSLGHSWSHVLEVNVAKLEARYPKGKFDAYRSLNRDLAAEKAAMRAV